MKKRAAAHGDIAEAAGAILKKLDAVEDRLILHGDQKDTYGLLVHARLNAVMGELMSVVAIADSKPTRVTQHLFAEHAAAIDAEIADLRGGVNTDVAALNALITARGIPAIG